MKNQVTKKKKEDLPTGYKISFLIADRGTSQEELAKKIGVSSPMVSYVIWGQKTSPKTRKKIAKELGFESWEALVNHKEVL